MKVGLWRGACHDMEVLEYLRDRRGARARVRVFLSYIFIFYCFFLLSCEFTFSCILRELV